MGEDRKDFVSEYGRIQLVIRSLFWGVCGDHNHDCGQAGYGGAEIDERRLDCGGRKLFILKSVQEKRMK